MFRKMLVCSDLSPASEALIDCVAELKSLGMEEAILTHVLYVANTPGLEEMLAEEAHPVLDRQKKILEDQGIRVTVELPFGLPAYCLNETAEKHDVSGILIGSHGKGILHSVALGSVTEKLLHLSRRPVLMARIAILNGEKCHLACGKLFRNILYPSDFSETAERALDYLAKIAAETKSRVTLLHVCDEKDSENWQHLADGARFLAEAKKIRLLSRGISDVTTEIASGDPAKEIIDRAAQGGFSLIVMGSQGKGLVREMFLGSVSHKVIRNASLPVLLVPAALT